LSSQRDLRSIAPALKRNLVYCLNVGGVQIDQAVADAFLKALTPAALEVTQLAIQQLETDHEVPQTSVADQLGLPGQTDVD
jgi:hypothetical protein